MNADKNNGGHVPPTRAPGPGICRNASIYCMCFRSRKVFPVQSRGYVMKQRHQAF